MVEKVGAFVLMPYTVKGSSMSDYSDPDHWSNVYEGLIRPAAENSGLDVQRDKEDLKSRHITDGILSKIENAQIIICDLSGYNPNVHLELGWAMRANRPYVLMKDEKTEFPFDLNQGFTVDYRSSLQPMVLREDLNKLKSAVQRTMQDKEMNWSVTKRVGITVSAIAASVSGANEINTQLLLQIREMVSSIPQNGDRRTALVESFVWPALLHEGLQALTSIGSTLSGSSITKPGFHASLRETLRNMGLEHRTDVQLSIISDARAFLYHDWERMIGLPATKAVSGVGDLYDEVFRYDSGAVAWIDKSTNTPSLSQGRSLRLNIGLFRPISDSAAKAFMELHQEL